MGKNRRSELLSDLHNTKQALQASEKRGRRAIKRLRELEKALGPVIQRMEFWATSQLSDEHNAFKVMTVGQCRQLLPLLRDEPESESTEEDTEAIEAA